MNLPDDILTGALDALTDDGDSYELPDGHVLRLHVEHDPDTDINDFDCYGRWSHAQGHHNDRQERPSDMDGSARKIWTSRSDWVWWQPDKDMKSAKAWGGDPVDYERVLRDYVEHVTELLQGGFYTVGVTLHETVTDSLGHEHTVQIAADYIGGVDSITPDHLRELVSDLIGEVVQI